jgi:asparagine synthase (glutamine-hydrolysing)
MCGIFGIFHATSIDSADLRQRALEASKRLRHRGPDWSGVKMCDDHSVIVHERLAIMDPESGEQPLISNDGKIILAVNGEIYNYKELMSMLKEPYDFQTGSDCEVLIPLWQQYGKDFLNMVRGMYAFVLYDTSTSEYIAVRDHMGICPLYMGWCSDGAVVFSSEMKGLNEICSRFECFPPGHIYVSTEFETTRWFNPDWLQPGHIGAKPLDLLKVREGFEKVVESYMMSDVPWGVLLSGGLDSSLVSAIAMRVFKKRRALAAAAGEEGVDLRSTKFPAIHSFSIGLEGSPDLVAAKKVADFLGTVHHSYTFTIQQGLDALSEAVYHMETYDVTTIRAGTPMFLMARKIKALGVKMVLSGEGADELYGGYLYFHKCPDKQEFHDECVDKLSRLHMFDNARANKSTAAWGVEARVPFLDVDVLQTGMEIDGEAKMIKDHGDGRGKIEKWILRKAFDTPEDPYLPDEILWRQKEQFSDGVGYSWIDSIRALAESSVTDAQMKQAKFLFVHNTPVTKEAYMVRQMFEKHFPQHSATLTVPGGKTIACSTERAFAWDKAFSEMGDASGRAVTGVHVDRGGDGGVSGAGFKMAEVTEVGEKQSMGSPRSGTGGGGEKKKQKLGVF